MIARRDSGKPTKAVEAKTRRCVASANSKPPPRAGEARAEMVGIGRVEREVKVERRVARNVFVSSLVILCLSFKSAPAQKTLSMPLARIKTLVGPLICPLTPSPSLHSAVSPALLTRWWASERLHASSSAELRLVRTKSPCDSRRATSSRNSLSSCPEIAFRFRGLSSESMRMWPTCGARMLVTLTRGELLRGVGTDTAEI